MLDREAGNDARLSSVGAATTPIVNAIGNVDGSSEESVGECPLLTGLPFEESTELAAGGLKGT